MRPARRRLGLVVAVLVGACLATGCENMGQNDEWNTDEDGKLKAAAVSQYPDVPVPSGFKYVEPGSGHVTLTTARFACHQMEGTAPKVLVVKFYQDSLQLSNWEWLADASFADETYMVFEKKNERCMVMIRRHQDKTILRLWIWTAKPPEEGPKK